MKKSMDKKIDSCLQNEQLIASPKITENIGNHIFKVYFRPNNVCVLRFHFLEGQVWIDVLPSSQSLPSYPAVHVQLYSFLSGVQGLPFWQGAEVSHTFLSENKYKAT